MPPSSCPLACIVTFAKLPTPPKKTHIPLGALPARFRRERVLIVGCGDVGLRVAHLLHRSGAAVRPHLLALSNSPERAPLLRQAGIRVLCGDLDRPATVRRLAALGTRVLHLAPPAPQGQHDLRTRALLRALRLRRWPQTFVYGSTTGVYGDCAGAWVAESRPCAPTTARAQRRADAESRVRQWGRAGVRVSILRIPGIYAPDRPGGTPVQRLRQGTPVLEAAHDVYTNHIHADDLARACVLALWRARAQRVFNVSDQSDLKMGDYFDLAADLYGLPRAARISRAQAQHQLSPLQLSFMGESRRLRTERLHQELRLVLHYPTVVEGLSGLRSNHALSKPKPQP